MWTLNIYRRLISIQIRSQLQYRGSFLLEIIGTAFMLLMFFVAIVLVLQKFGHIAGWTLGDIAFLWGMTELAFATMDMIFSGFDPQNFGKRVRLGTFDQFLLRPVNITWQVLGSDFVIRRVGKLIEGLVIFGIALYLVDIQWTPGKLIYLPIVWGSLVCFFGGLFVIGSTITFWTIESIEVVNIFTYGGQEMMSYPMSIYPNLLRRFFTYIIPAIFLMYYPALYFLDKTDPLNPPPITSFLAPVAGGGTLVVALLFWRFGIKHYQSTGS